MDHRRLRTWTRGQPEATIARITWFPRWAVHTDMTASLADDPEFEPWLRTRTSVGRWGRPEDIAGTIIYLASDSASFVNGQVIAIDGGLAVAI